MANCPKMESEKLLKSAIFSNLWLMKVSQPHIPEFRNISENCHPCDKHLRYSLSGKYISQTSYMQSLSNLAGLRSRVDWFES